MTAQPLVDTQDLLMSVCKETQDGPHPSEALQRSELQQRPDCGLTVSESNMSSDNPGLNDTQPCVRNPLWRDRVRSKSPTLYFKKRKFHMLEDELNQEESHVDSGMESFWKHLPTPTCAGVFTASCLLLIPLIIVLRRYS